MALWGRFQQPFTDPADGEKSLEGWRKANVTSTLQKGREEPGNCGCISLTPVPRKVMELIPGSISRHI